MRSNESRATGALLGSVLAAALVAPAGATAHAEEAADAADSNGRPQIVVLGQRAEDANPNAQDGAPYKVNKSQNGKFTEPLRDTPKTITAIPKEVIEDIGATSFREVVRSTPGVTLGTGEGGNAFGDRIFIRGFEARNDVYIDGLRDPGVTSREVFAVEQIEVIKGPSATYGGRGTTGGLVSVQSKRAATDRSFLVADAGLGTDNYKRFTIDGNAKIADGWALRVNGMFHDADTPGRDHVWQRRWGVAAALTGEVTDRLTLRADYYHTQLDGMPDYGHPFDATIQQPAKVDRDNFYGILARDFIKNGADVGTLAADWEATEGLSIHGTVRYGETYNRYIVSAPENPNLTAGTVTANPKNSNRDNRYYAASLYAVAEVPTGPFQHKIVFGGDFSDEKVRNQPYTITSTSNGSATNPVYTSRFGVVLDLQNPDNYVPFDFPVGLGVVSHNRVRSLGAYAIDTITLAKGLTATLGLRGDTFTIDYDTEDGNSALAGNQPLALRSDTGFLNWQGALTYKPVEALTIYGSYATSSNPSGEQIDATSAGYDGLGTANVNLQPERNKAWEGGVKWETAGGKLLLSAAAFRITKENARELQGDGTYQLVGKLRSQGFEASVNGTLFERLNLFGGYTYTDAKIVASSNAANVGKIFANIPKHSASLLATLLVTSNFEFGGQATYRSELFGGTAAAGTARVPGYTRFDIVARWKPTTWLETRLNVNNVTDKTYYDAIYRSATPFAYVAPGRSAMLTFTVRY